MIRFLRLALFFALIATPAAAMTVEEVTSPQGISGWLVRDPSVPVVSVSFAFRGGVEQDPQNREGLTALLADLMTEGAGERDAAAFQQALADHGISFGLSGERDVVSGGLRALKDELPMAAALVRDALTAPRFDNDAIARIKAEHGSIIASRLADPEWQGRRFLYTLLFPGHPYALRSYGSAASNAAVTQSELRAEHKKRFARDNLLVAAVGDLDAEAYGKLLDAMFGALPDKAELRPVAAVAAPDKGMTARMPYGGGQSTLMFAAPGVKRDDPDWHAVSILNYALGGGGFSSRLMDEVRDKRGLTYHIGTSLAPMAATGIIIGTAQTANAKANESWSLTRDVWAQVWTHGLTDAEIKAAKDYLIGALATSFTSTGAIASILNDLQQQNLPSDYLETRAAALQAVTPDDVNRAAKRLLDPARLTLVVVGQPENLPVQREEKFIEQ